MNEKITSELGNIYYEYDEDKDVFHTYRIMKIKNEDDVTCMLDNDKDDTKTMSMKQIKSDYIQLGADAILTVSRVIVAFVKETPVYDIVVMVYKKSSSSTYEVPDIIARQSISDIFYEPFCNQGENPLVGISTMADTLPAGYTMDMLTAIDQLEESIFVNVYKDDTLEMITRLADHKKWDKTFEMLLKDHYDSLRLKNPFLNEEYPHEVNGYCDTLEGFLKINNFMYDFYRLFGIIKVNFEIEKWADSTHYDEIVSLPKDQQDIIQDIYEINMRATVVLKYDYTVDLTEIKMPYVLIMDCKDRLFVIGFLQSEDEYVKVIDATSQSTYQDEVIKRLRNQIDYYDKYSE